MDDCLAGANTPQETAQLYKELRALLLKGVFDLRKWRSSSSKVMDSFPSDIHESSQLKSITDDKSHQKALGMHWDWHNDHLYVSVGSTTTSQTFTKQSLVSDITRTFDVLVWFSPSMIMMKILFQQPWEMKVEPE